MEDDPCVYGDLSMHTKPKLAGVNIVTIFSPSKFTVVYNERPLHLLQELESEIAKAWDHTEPFTIGKLMPTATMFVAYRDEAGGGSCKRAYINSGMVGDFAELFLVDYGTFVTADAVHKCIPLAEEHRWKLGFYSSIIIIPGLIPAIPLRLPSGVKMMPGNSWSQAAISAGKKWLEGAGSLAVTRFQAESPVMFTGDVYKENCKYPFSQFLEQENLGMIHFNE